jgi:muramidase (phage lysozyme)
MAAMPGRKPRSVVDVLAEPWRRAAEKNRQLQARNDPLYRADGRDRGASPPSTEDVRRAAAVDFGAGAILELIPHGEGTTGASGYDMTYNNLDGRHYPKGWKKPTELTIDEAISMESDARRIAGDYAVGRYQFKPRTLGELKKRMGLSGSEVMTPSFQDRMARELLLKRGYDKYLRGEIDAGQLQDNLALEWASFSGTDGFSPYDPRHTGRPRVGSAAIQGAIAKAKSQNEQLNDSGRYPANATPWR